jgi:hypothetical protein
MFPQTLGSSTFPETFHAFSEDSNSERFQEEDQKLLIEIVLRSPEAKIEEIDLLDVANRFIPLSPLTLVDGISSIPSYNSTSGEL